MFVAAENGALPGGKVGGVGDVVRDLPVALAALGWHVTVVTPGYGYLGQNSGATAAGTLDVRFRGESLAIQVLDVPGSTDGVRHRLIEHPALAPLGPGFIYCNDPPEQPFATDANKFALFAAAAARLAAGTRPLPDVVHLHDWHAALYALLRRYDPGLRELASVTTVFTIHNLAYQGIRPLEGDPSSLAAWFPQLDYDYDTVVDPRYTDCINPVAAAIRLVERISTVSPTYATEIRQPDDPQRGFHGGEGLEHDLQAAASANRLTGILNGTVYPRVRARRPGWRRFVAALTDCIDDWQQAGAGTESHATARQRLDACGRRRPRHVLTSVGRLTAQKVGLFLQPDANGTPALEAILKRLGGDGIVILLGSGEEPFAAQLTDIAARHANFVFLCGYSEPCAELLYIGGDLFLMPSTFEPCGISQLLAMRSGQPCIVHAVGGLNDTVANNVSGFTFGGDGPTAQATAFVSAVDRALALRNEQPERWQAMVNAATSQRFDWPNAAKQYIKQLYV
ncbi:MAG: glycogen/starch synthase [Woeseiaceae bacterium]|nr:glycogen/starch synthase [Woeseiaceae bacterium]